MEVDNVEDEKHEKDEWVASLGHGPTQGATGKSGKGKDDSKGKGEGYGKDWKGGGNKGKGAWRRQG